ncbi:cytochrome P450 [Trujillonella endophytica]|uniref:Cytochrome P450 n=1 Tax=Trujillonella endophytica TaxID=673521 RepID=A0A1H8VZ12_9ACTN|nr:cytochrome P450 [Trujillella endophytica]SEP20564.1 Cytochrome P450 [Trujillella endophytica]
MSVDEASAAAPKDRAPAVIELDRHGDEYRTDFVRWSDDLHARAPIAFNDTHGGYWFVSGNQELFDTARRADVLSNDSDPHGDRKGYQGITIPGLDPEQAKAQSGPPGSLGGNFLMLDPPVQRHYRNALNAYLSPAAVARWQPVLDEITRAALDEVIETGRIDFVDDLANIVPAVLTMAMLGFPIDDYETYVEPIHAQVYTKPGTPEMDRVVEGLIEMAGRTFGYIADIRANPRPGLVDALIKADITGRKPEDFDVFGAVSLLIGGGFDTTTALTAHSLEWLSEHPDQRERLIRDWEELRDSATEEFLRFYTPAPGDGRTIAMDAEIHGVQFKEGERLWLSWAMANRDATVFEDPHEIKLDRKGNRHASFGLGVHRCIGSNVARATFKTMLKAVLDRMPDFVCDPAGAVHYDTVGVINGLKHLPATFTPGKRLGPGLAETIATLQAVVDEQRLAEPVTARKDTAGTPS